MKKISVYIGSGAYQAHDVEACLVAFDVPFDRVCEHQLNKLPPHSVLVVPGGQMSGYLRAWGTSGITAIRKFVQGGGTYVGICAGAYVAGKKYQSRKALGLVPIEMKFRRGLRNVAARKAATTTTGKHVPLIVENGPDLCATGAGGSVLLVGPNGMPLAVRAAYGKGSSILLAGHAEGSTFYNRPPKRSAGARYFVQLVRSL